MAVAITHSVQERIHSEGLGFTLSLRHPILQISNILNENLTLHLIGASMFSPY